MARGRMLNKSISMSRKFQDLPDDTCRLLATWTIAHLDIRGVFSANPTLVKSLVFPHRDDVTSDRVRGYLDAMESVNLIVRFEAKGEVWQRWPGFEENQGAIRYDREFSDYPPMPGWMPPPVLAECPDIGGTSAGQAHDKNPRKLREVKSKLKEVKDKKGADAPAHPPAVDVYRNVVRIFPDRILWEEIGATVGDDPTKLDFWRQVVYRYVACGWSRKNVGAMLDWFKRGEIPHTGNGNSRSSPQDKFSKAELMTRERLSANGKH